MDCAVVAARLPLIRLVPLIPFIHVGSGLRNGACPILVGSDDAIAVHISAAPYATCEEAETQAKNESTAAHKPWQQGSARVPDRGQRGALGGHKRHGAGAHHLGSHQVALNGLWCVR